MYKDLPETSEREVGREERGCDRKGGTGLPRALLLNTVFIALGNDLRLIIEDE